MALANVAGTGRPTRRRLDKSIGGIIASKGRAEAAGVDFNLFPQIGDELPGILERIVEETMDAVEAGAEQRAPVGPTGKLRTERKRRVYRSRRSGGVISGRIDWNARDDYVRKRVSQVGRHVFQSGTQKVKHEYPFFVEVGTEDTPAQPFVVPTLVAERPRFNARLRALESRLPRR